MAGSGRGSWPSPLVAKDLADLDFVAAHADCVAYSFVQRPDNVVRLQRELARRRPGRLLRPVVLRVETALAVESASERRSEVQEQICGSAKPHKSR